MSQRQIPDELLSQIERDRELIEQELPALADRDARMREAAAEDTLCGHLRQAIHRSRRPLRDIAHEAGITATVLGDFLEGERTLRSDVLDRLTQAVGLAMPPGPLVAHEEGVDTEIEERGDSSSLNPAPALAGVRLMESLVFSQYPAVVVATNTFIDVPIIIQYEQTPMLEMLHEVAVGYTIKIPIFHSDGTQLAVVKGAQLYLTDAGKKAGLTLRHPQKMTVCELGGKTLFEVRRDEPAALKMSAELFTNDGTFLKWSDESISGLLFNDPNRPLSFRGIVMAHNVIRGFRVGVLVNKDGIAIGVS